MSKNIYLAAPYSDADPSVRQQRFETVSRFAASMMEADVHVYSPITFGHTLASFGDLPTDFNFWRGHCTSFLWDWADELHVLMLPNWQESTGVVAEIRAARARDISIKYISEQGNQDFICPWCHKVWPLEDYSVHWDTIIPVDFDPSFREIMIRLQCDTCSSESLATYNVVNKSLTFKKAEESDE